MVALLVQLVARMLWRSQREVDVSNWLFEQEDSGYSGRCLSCPGRLSNEVWSQMFHFFINWP